METTREGAGLLELNATNLLAVELPAVGEEAFGAKVEFLKTAGGVFSFPLAPAALPKSTSSKAKSDPSSSRSSVAMVTLPWATTCANKQNYQHFPEQAPGQVGSEPQRWWREGALEQEPQQVDASVRRRRGEQARRREASTSTPSPPSPGKRSRGQKGALDGNLCR